jgi:hypothetical protein
LAPNGTLADVAPSVLTLMGLPVPEGMTGRSLLLHPLPSQPTAFMEERRMANAG